jgi:hypothetical protein
MSDQAMNQIWQRGKRQHVIECLARDEVPYANWQHEFPDLAAERLIHVQDTSELYAMRTQALMLHNTDQVDLINAELKRRHLEKKGKQ